MIRHFDSTFTIEGVEYEVEWEMDCSIPVWSLVGDTVTNGPDLTDDVRDKLDKAIHDYMREYYYDP